MELVRLLLSFLLLAGLVVLVLRLQLPGVLVGSLADIRSDFPHDLLQVALHQTEEAGQYKTYFIS